MISETHSSVEIITVVLFLPLAVVIFVLLILLCVGGEDKKEQPSEPQPIRKNTEGKESVTQIKIDPAQLPQLEKLMSSDNYDFVKALSINAKNHTKHYIADSTSLDDGETIARAIGCVLEQHSKLTGFVKNIITNEVTTASMYDNVTFH